MTEAGAVLQKTVVLVGMMGAGKSAVGAALARALAAPLRDCDDEIVKAADRSIAEIFARDGEAFFRAREHEVIARLLRERPPVVLSTGGGAFVQPANRELIHREGISVWLRADPELLWQRVRHKTTRPLLQTENPRQTLLDLHAARTPAYAQADLVVDAAAELSVEQMAAKVLAVLRATPGILTDQKDE